MKVTAKDKEYFSGGMHQLADHFNRTAAKWAGQDKPLTAAQKQSMQARLGKVESLFDEFTNKGYTRRQWNNLLESSGAADKMGDFGGAYRMLTDRQVDVIVNGAKKHAR